jgi:hypothetical protein
MNNSQQLARRTPAAGASRSLICSGFVTLVGDSVKMSAFPARRDNSSRAA